MKYRKQKSKSRRQLHPLYERILLNHLHNLTQRKISAIRDLFEQLPNDPQDLDRKFVDDAFGDMSPAARAVLSLRLRPIEEALRRNLSMMVETNMVKTWDHPPYYDETLDAVILILKAKREKMHDHLLSSRNVRHAIAEYLGVELQGINYHLTKYVTSELLRRNIIELWDETQHGKTTAKLYRINITILDTPDAHEKSRVEP